MKNDYQQFFLMVSFYSETGNIREGLRNLSYVQRLEFAQFYCVDFAVVNDMLNSTTGI